jgi:hypothetical protein
VTMKTNDLIERLARGVEPVAPLQRPWLRATTWLVGAVVYMSVLTVMMTSTADVTANGTSSRFLFPQIAAIAVSAAAAAAAFASVVPGASTRVLIWPAGAIALWLGTLLVGSLQEWQTIGPAGLAPPGEWLCVAMIAFGAALPALGMMLMLRQGAPLTPRVTTALAVLAAAGLANAGVCVSNPHPSSAVVLIWHGTTLLVLVAASSWAGRSLLSWHRIRHLN